VVQVVRLLVEMGSLAVQELQVERGQVEQVQVQQAEAEMAAVGVHRERVGLHQLMQVEQAVAVD
jgi:hypothetical protein